MAKINDESSSFSRLKKPETVTFVPLGQAAEDAKGSPALFAPCDLDKSFDDNRRSAIFSSFQALNDFVKSRGRVPGKDDWESFATTAKTSWGDEESTKDKDWENH